MDIEIPSPSVFLRRTPSPPAISTEATVTTPTNRPRNNQDGRPPAQRRNTQETGVAKSKQTKSRNGCITCKKKRLKCDETVPTCVQCQKRRVECEGYKTEYKWRTFEELAKSKTIRSGNGASARANKPKKDVTFAKQEVTTKPKSQPIAPVPEQDLGTPEDDLDVDKAISPSTKEPATVELASPPNDHPLPTSDASENESASLPKLEFGLPNAFDNPEPGSHMEFSDFFGEAESLEYGDGDGYQHDYDYQVFPPPSKHRLMSASALMSDNGNDFWSDSAGWGVPMPPVHDADFANDAEELEIVAHENENSRAMDRFSRHNASSNNTSYRVPAQVLSYSAANTQGFAMFKTPTFDLSAPEMLILRFDRETCGVLSIKDGRYENPWRTLIWPLAKDSEPLYHAIMAMSALHGAGAGDAPQLRVTGVAHMTKSISKLSENISHISVEQALATTLALALAEAWDDKITTGIQHLKGARFLLERALEQRGRNPEGKGDGRPLRFLANTYIYLEAIGRLTRTMHLENYDLTYLLQETAEPHDSDFEVDPLLGCGASLFPLLAQVAGLVHQVRGVTENSLKIISEANELKEQLLNWQPSDMRLFVQPEDPTSNVSHALQTAEAYRRAILLHLDQAIPELADASPYDQAKGILLMLATVPLSSRSLVIQIFPLLVGSCEMVTSEDRQWATRRWEAMMQRLSLINVSACWQVVEEVWRRRDAQARISSRMAASRDPNLKYNSDPVSTVVARQRPAQPPRYRAGNTPLDAQLECTVRGQLHWLGVMSDWAWEVFL